MQINTLFDIDDMVYVIVWKEEQCPECKRWHGSKYEALKRPLKITGIHFSSRGSKTVNYSVKSNKYGCFDEKSCHSTYQEARRVAELRNKKDDS
jgi:hypothetical protein